VCHGVEQTMPVAISFGQQKPNVTKCSPDLPQKTLKFEKKNAFKVKGQGQMSSRSNYFSGSPTYFCQVTPSSCQQFLSYWHAGTHAHFNLYICVISFKLCYFV